MDEQELKNFFKRTFDDVAEGYDNASMRFFPDTAARIPEFLGLKGYEHVLDVATGTGVVALAMAAALPEGKVTGIDISPGMLAQAVRKKDSIGRDNVTFMEMDMTRLGFPADHFDAAVCAFGIFFINDMKRQLSHISEKVKTGGRVMTTTFSFGSFSPLADIFLERLKKYGIEPPTMSWKRISSVEQCKELFGSSGLADIECQKVDAGYYLDDADDWWHIIWNGGFRGLVNKLSDDDRERFRVEHLEEIDDLSDGEGIKLEMEVLYTRGTRV
ncbi:MAG: methyltransferase domain-containing protein [Nitrospirota bacterium]|nr:MAG: methyltransferase domain-containing protein [Nitrospirota bacterium]